MSEIVKTTQNFPGFGDLMLVFHENAVVVLTPNEVLAPNVAPAGRTEEATILINNVPYTLRIELERDDTEGWRLHPQSSIFRGLWRADRIYPHEPTWKAANKVRDVLLPQIIEFIELCPGLVRRGAIRTAEDKLERARADADKAEKDLADAHAAVSAAHDKVIELGGSDD